MGSCVDVLPVYLPGASTRRMCRRQRLRTETTQAIRTGVRKDLYEDTAFFESLRDIEGRTYEAGDVHRPPIPGSDYDECPQSPVRRRTTRRDTASVPEPPSPIVSTPPRMATTRAPTTPQECDTFLLDSEEQPLERGVWGVCGQRSC